MDAALLRQPTLRDAAVRSAMGHNPNRMHTRWVGVCTSYLFGLLTDFNALDQTNFVSQNQAIDMLGLVMGGGRAGELLMVRLAALHATLC